MKTSSEPADGGDGRAVDAGIEARATNAVKCAKGVGHRGEFVRVVCRGRNGVRLLRGAEGRGRTKPDATTGHRCDAALLGNVVRVDADRVAIGTDGGLRYELNVSASVRLILQM